MNTYLIFRNTINIFVFLFFSLFSFMLIAQNTWVGGMPGQESAWNQPRNWSEGHVPNWSDELVIIPNVSTTTGVYPVIDNTVEEIPALLVKGGAALTILAEGELRINGETTYNYGLLNQGQVKSDGVLSIVNTSLAALEGSSVHDLTGQYLVDVIKRADGHFRFCVE